MLHLFLFHLAGNSRMSYTLKEVWLVYLGYVVYNEERDKSTFLLSLLVATTSDVTAKIR